MKKTIWITVVALLALGHVLWGQSITVTSPAANAAYCQGSTVQINWTSSGIPGDVSIHLCPADPPGAGSLMILAAPTANDGSHSWTISPTYPTGYYRIRVQSGVGGAITKGESAIFRIKACPTIAKPGGTLQNVSKPGPKPGATVQPLQPPNVQFTSYANLYSFKVNGQSSSSNSNRIVCHRNSGILLQANATSSVAPISYRFQVHIVSIYDNMLHPIYDSGWITQNQVTVNMTYNQALDKIAPNGIPEGQTIYALWLGEATVQAKNSSQTETPQEKLHLIKYFID